MLFPAEVLHQFEVDQDHQANDLVAGIEAKANNRSIVDLDVDIAGENGNACAQVRHRFMLLTNLTEEAS